MTAEQRANALAEDLLDRGMVPILTREARVIIAAAIREAENAKLDEAIEKLRPDTPEGLWTDIPSVTRTLRSIKSEGAKA